ncbi:MAG: mucin desulfatase, partial [Lentisphaerae bacterium]|nr:mucin desulfatase [Lentisphaerota bacterium]
YDESTGLKHAYESARMFGRFQELLADFPQENLHETIPWFHHTPRRLATLKDAIEKDVANRAASSEDEINFCSRTRKHYSDHYRFDR